MKLSAAIRAGSKMHGPAEKGWSDIGPDGEVRTCPLVAAAEAYGTIVIDGTKFLHGPKWNGLVTAPPIKRGAADDECETFDSAPDEWVAILMFMSAPPCTCGKSEAKPQLHASETVRHLYDAHKWPREEIADWVEKAEEQLDHKQWVAAYGPDKPWTPGLEW